jgi:hypothetical protein
VKVYHEGAKKYGENTWQNLDDGYNRYKGAMMRHLVLYEKGEIFDEETGCRHLAQVAWNAIAMLHCSLHIKGGFKCNEADERFVDWLNKKSNAEKKEKSPAFYGGLCDRIINKEQEYDIRCQTTSDGIYLFDMNNVTKLERVISALHITNKTVKVAEVALLHFPFDFDKANEKQKEFYISAMNFLDFK